MRAARLLGLWGLALLVTAVLGACGAGHAEGGGPVPGSGTSAAAHADAGD